MNPQDLTTERARTAYNLANVVDGGNMAIFKHLLKLEEEIKTLRASIPNLVDTVELVKGKPGKNGEVGPKGEKGDRGEQGIQGVMGMIGPKGKDGINGKDGVNGKDGLRGLQGIQGIKGDTGERGPEGKTSRPFIGGRVGVQVLSNGAKVATKANIVNFTTGFTITNVSGTPTIAGSSSGHQTPLTGVVNGSNTVFTWTSAPTALMVDRVPMQKTSSDGTVNWTGTTTTTLTIAPANDIFAVS